jgi:hypothetical protein
LFQYLICCSPSAWNDGAARLRSFAAMPMQAMRSAEMAAAPTG